jgi:16S rRNA (adenine1518-N6/adenine1519-N6)-dimethyltransferase
VLTGRRAGSTSTSSRKRGNAPTHGRPKKRFGQHFLNDPAILSKIVEAAEVGAGDTIVEIGPGLGALTEAIAARALQVIAVEVDHDLTPMLTARFESSSNVTIVSGDILALTPDDMLAAAGAAPPYAVVANLPYNIAAAVLRLFLEAATPPVRMTVMVQLEVAEAMTAKPGKMSLLSVATQLYADARIVMKVAPGSFNPPPKVHSAVVRIDVLPQPRVAVPIEQFFRVVRAGFGNPRKQLRNSLSFGLHVKQEVIDSIMHRAEVDPTLRPQMLAIDDWERIARAWLGRTAR